MCERFDRKERKKVTVTRPAAVQVYNSYMGGVDKADMLLALYRTKFRSRKLYHRVSFHLISQCGVNAWIVYRQIGSTDSYLCFLTSICISLANPSPAEETEYEPPTRKRVKAIDIPKNVRCDLYDHWPLLQNILHAQQCKMDGCEKRTMFLCSKCKVYLCVTKSTCFLNFHGKVF